MNVTRNAAIAALLTLGLFGSALAQESSYKPGTVWTVSAIKTEPGQFENYMDWLGGQWRKIQELGKKEGVVVSYHVFSVNNARAGEPDMYLAVEYKDYISTAAQEALQKKVNAMLASDDRKLDAASGERKVMRTLMGSMEMQELLLK